jgi:hypothetical protein
MLWFIDVSFIIDIKWFTFNSIVLQWLISPQANGKGFNIGDACVLNLFDFAPLPGYSQHNAKKEFDIKYDMTSSTAILTVWIQSKRK